MSVSVRAPRFIVSRPFLQYDKVPRGGGGGAHGDDTLHLKANNWEIWSFVNSTGKGRPKLRKALSGLKLGNTQGNQ